MLRKCIVLVAVSCLVTSAVQAQGDKVFKVALSDLDTWSRNVLVTLDDVTITGKSNVHPLNSDCEMHFGARVQGFQGEPDGWVLEPMNICEVAFFGKSVYAKSDWNQFGQSLKGKKVKVVGVPRIWPEHLDGAESDSNPNHALELHPLVRVMLGPKAFDFSKFIFAPEGYRGGVSFETAKRIVEDTEVGVTRTGDTVEIDFESARIGNFTSLDLRIPKDTIEEVDGSHRMDGEVVLGRGARRPVRLITVKGTAINDVIQRFKTGSRTRPLRFEALVLFSLSPKALHDAAQKSNGQRVEVDRPVQLIIYGTPESE